MVSRKDRLYGLFEVIKKDGKKEYKRLLPESAYPKKVAVRVFQNALLAPYFGGAEHLRELRPVK